MSDRQPHPDSTGWTLEVSREELDRVISLCAACLGGSSVEHYVSVGVVDCTTRRWLIDGPDAEGWHDVTCDPRDPVESVRIPRYLLDGAIPLVEPLGTVLFYRDRLSGSFVARAGDDMVVVDAWGEDADEEGDVLDFVYDPALVTLKAMVPLDTLRRISFEYGQYLELASDRVRGEAPAFTTLELTEGRVRWRSDWTRWGVPAQSGSAQADTVGAGAVGFLGYAMWRSIVHADPAEHATIGWNGDMPDFVWLVMGDWGISCAVNDELMFRHRWKIEAAFSMADFNPDYDLDRPQTALTHVGPVKRFVKDSLSVAVTVMSAGKDVVDHVRISTRVATLDADIAAARREIDRLNDALSGAKMLVRDREVHLAIDFPAQDRPEGYLPLIALLEDYAERCRGLDEFLPLFADD
jgi:hypothetical protein